MKNLFGIIIILIIVACSGSKDSEVTLNEGFSPISNVLTIEPQYFEINTTRDTVLLGVNGTRIEFPSNCFETSEEFVLIELKEYYNLPTMIMGGLTTVSDNLILETDGMIYLNCENKDGDMIDLKKNCFIEMPSIYETSEMNLFIGQETNGSINWLEEKGSTTELYSIDVLGEGIGGSKIDSFYMNFFEVSKLGWINADKFLKLENESDVLVDIQDRQGVFYSMIFYDYNSIIKGTINEGEKLEFSNIPVGLDVSIIGLGAKGDDVYFNFLEANTNHKGLKFPKLKLIEEEKLKEILNNKFGSSLANRPEQSFTYEW